MKNKTFYITTPIYYPSGNLHIGHLYTTTIAWVMRNYKKKLGYDTLFLTGSDEHGQKIEQMAKKANMNPQDYVNLMSSKFIKLWESYKIDYDIFARTTNKEHINIVKAIFNTLYIDKRIYLDKYKGLYSILDEEFIKEQDALKIDNIFYHPISKHKLEYIEEESYFLKISKNISWLENYIYKHKNFIMPIKMANELKTNFFNIGIRDLSITRTSFDWGIQIDNNPKHTIYVWLDALSNYITMLGYKSSNDSLYKKFWEEGNERVHIIGKEISRFHCIYWPSILHFLNLKQPTRIQSHGWIITPDGKMSKSKNNVVDPLLLLKDFDPEIIKYFLVRKFKLENDNIFSIKLLTEAYNLDLANTFGNLVSRTISMFKNNFPSSILKNIKERLTIDKSLENKIAECFLNYKSNMDNFIIDEAIDNIMLLARYSNNYIDLTKPWTLNHDPKRLMIILYNLFNSIYAIASMLEMIMPGKMKIIAKIYSLSILEFNNITNFDKLNNIKLFINDFKNIFPRMQ